MGPCYQVASLWFCFALSVAHGNGTDVGFSDFIIIFAILIKIIILKFKLIKMAFKKICVKYWQVFISMIPLNVSHPSGR